MIDMIDWMISVLVSVERDVDGLSETPAESILIARLCEIDADDDAGSAPYGLARDRVTAGQRKGGAFGCHDIPIGGGRSPAYIFPYYVQSLEPLAPDGEPCLTFGRSAGEKLRGSVFRFSLASRFANIPN
jgi:hypothetical protein